MKLKEVSATYSVARVSQSGDTIQVTRGAPSNNLKSTYPGVPGRHVKLFWDDHKIWAL